MLRPIINILRRPLNPVIIALAGSRALRSFAVIHHQGRRSGRAYATPVSARPIPGGFMIPLTFGEGADWYQNVRAAGGCTIRWNGADYAVVDPEIVELETARPAFSRIEQALLPLLGIERFVQVRYATAGEYETGRIARTTADQPANGQAFPPLPGSQAKHEVAS
jgi:deazaflavin-dependent oxidoreductase (nitroreductase family)